jgi:hypothetical protein
MTGPDVNHRTLLCIVTGGDSATFEITAHINDEVGDLKKLLFVEIDDTFSDIRVSAVDLILWKVCQVQSLSSTV